MPRAPKPDFQLAHAAAIANHLVLARSNLHARACIVPLPAQTPGEPVAGNKSVQDRITGGLMGNNPPSAEPNP